MFYSMWAHRKSRGAKPADFHESTAVEIAWTVVPFLIVIGLAIPATRMVVEQKDTSQADLTIKATGYQWKWGYEYLKGEGEGISLPVDALDAARADRRHRAQVRDLPDGGRQPAGGAGRPEDPAWSSPPTT
jgi:cytochrome c oxidase subunit II